MKTRFASLSIALALGLITTSACTSKDGGADETGTESSDGTGEESSTSESSSTSEGETTGDTGGTEDCSNGLDDNGDLFVDCDDPLCVEEPSCQGPEGWTCPAEFYDEDESTLPPGMATCDCACGIPDPDCEQNLESGVFNCGPGESCNDQGECVPPPPEVCGNDVDDDLDALTDCEDPDCFGEEGCPPAGWTCSAAAYDQEAPDEVCDCECGALDPDCENPDNPSSDCDAGTACNTTDLTCDLVTGEDDCTNEVDDDADGVTDCDDQECFGVGECPIPGWICNPSLFDTGGPDAACDCNCGTYDPDCDIADAPIFGCGTSEAVCNDEGACEIPVPDTWTCNPDFYAANDGCDCGCGAVDVDCASANADDCDFCGLTGSCDEGGMCPGNIDPTNNATCN